MGRREYLRAIHDRYQRGSPAKKGAILDELCHVRGYHRKHAIRLLNGPRPEVRPRPRRSRGPSYGRLAIQALAQVWEAAGYPWSVRLRALLPLWLPWLRKRLTLTAEIERQLRTISPRQIDLVSHSGACADGEFAHSFNLTDIHTPWTETRAVLGKGQTGIVAALEDMRQSLPFRLQGIDSDNGSEFLNAHLVRYCRTQQIQFTRGRPYKKDDNAHIEQKNWTHVRRLIGWDRYDSPAAVGLLNDLYRHELPRMMNLFQPSVKLRRKERIGSRVKRVYDVPQTPLDRLRAGPGIDQAAVAKLLRLRAATDPFVLAHTIEQKLERIAVLASRRDRSDRVTSQMA